MKKLLFLLLLLLFPFASRASTYDLGDDAYLFWWSDDPEPTQAPSKDKTPFKLDKVLELEKILSQKIFGQPEAVNTTANALICYKAGLQDPNQPIATLLYAGPTGVGKTQLATELTKVLLKNDSQMIHLNMSEFAMEEGLHGLIGVPYGYKESEKGGRLSNAISENPYSVVLLDEIEKASPKVRMLFLSIFDEGEFFDAKGKRIDCRNCLFILTTNIGASDILRHSEEPYEDLIRSIEPQLIKQLSPEFYNRLELVIFRGLTPEALDQIIDSKLKILAKRVADTKKVKIHFDPSVHEYLSANGYHPQLGARPLTRLIKHKVSLPIAQALIANPYKEGESFSLFCSGESFFVEKIQLQK